MAQPHAVRPVLAAVAVLGKPVIAGRRRHQELEKTLLEVAPGCDAKRTFSGDSALEAPLSAPLDAAQIYCRGQQFF
jgi:hypothetical protein